jgi:hypothetical protein
MGRVLRARTLGAVLAFVLLGVGCRGGSEAPVADAGAGEAEASHAGSVTAATALEVCAEAASTAEELRRTAERHRAAPAPEADDRDLAIATEAVATIARCHRQLRAVDGTDREDASAARATETFVQHTSRLERIAGEFGDGLRLEHELVPLSERYLQALDEWEVALERVRASRHAAG